MYTWNRFWEANTCAAEHSRNPHGLLEGTLVKRPDKLSKDDTHVARCILSFR